VLELAKRDEMRRLVGRLLEACADPRYERRKAIWTAHQHLQKVAKVPVHVHLFLSGDYSPVWQELIPEEQLVHKEGVARNVELQLRQRLYKHDNIPDDDVILPVLFASAVFCTAADRIWGLKLERREAQQGVYDGGAYKPVPPINAPDPGEGGKDFAVYCGDDTMVLQVLAQGGVGVVSGGSLVVGRRMKQMIAAYFQGDNATAQALHREMYELFRAFNQNGRVNPIPLLRAALSMTWREVGPPRLPLLPGTEAEKAELRRILVQLGLL
jgi:hypothetical protein